MTTRILVVLGLLATTACATTGPEVRARDATTGVQYVQATDEGGVVQAWSDDAAEEQMRGRCPGGYSIVNVEPVQVGERSTTVRGAWISTTESRPILARRFTYACTRFRVPQGATST